MTHPLHVPVGLAEIIATHEAMFGATVMLADDAGTTEGAKPAGESSGKAGDGQDADEKLGEGGIKALKAEREARQAQEAQVKALEAQVKELAPIKAQMDAIAATFGAQNGEKVPDVADQIAALQQRLAEMDAEKQRVSDVESVLSLTDKLGKYGDRLTAADVSLLKSLPSREAMEAVAKRLIEGAKPGIPKPDRSVAQGGSGTTIGGSVTAGRDLFRDRHTSKTTS